MLKTIHIRRPDDWHVHFRDTPYLADTVPASSQHFARALVMPNLIPPLTDIKSLSAYRDRILAACPTSHPFQPFMSFYLNTSVNPDELKQAAAIDYIVGAKLYPQGATTNADQGARSLKSIYPQLEVMQEADLVLQIHGESIHADIFRREAQFIQEELVNLCRNFPRLRIVLEHISTKAAVDFVESTTNVAATITAHHLLFNRNHLLSGGIRPHYYCLPILKHEDDQRAVQKAALSANPKFFAGTDSAPHAKKDKESACGCAGIYSAPYALALYTAFFDQFDKLHYLNDFMSRFGADFYQQPLNAGQIELVRKPQGIAETLAFADDQVIPIAAGQNISWSVNDTE